MVFKLNKKLLLSIIGFIIILALLFTVKCYYKSHNLFLGGIIHTAAKPEESLSVEANQFIDDNTTDNTPQNDYNERYQRPSKQPALINKYTFQMFVQNETGYTFYEPEDVIYAYYAILKEASNMSGYSGGCGTIGDAELPYSYAYRLFTEESLKNMSLIQFTDSFKGIGHITLLKLRPMPSPENSPDLKYYMAEIEVITGTETKNNDYNNGLSYFAYYYGIVTVRQENSSWLIQRIDYFPEEFLCAPYHSWFYDSTAVVQIVYIDNLKIIDKIDDILIEDSLVYIYATGKNAQKYRFDFLRLTNGHDILIRENIVRNNKLEQTDLLTDDWKYLKLTPY